MAGKCFFYDDVSDLKPEPWLKQPGAQHTASHWTTAGNCYPVTIFHLCSASTVDDPATSDSLPRSDVLHRCVWRATSGSAYSSDRSSREHDRTWDATKSLVDHLGSNDGQTFPYLTHGSVVNLAFANAKRSLHLTESLLNETSFRKPSVPWQKKQRILCAPCGWRREPRPKRLLTIEDHETQAPPQSACEACGTGRREADGASSFVSSSDEEKESPGRARVLQRRGRAQVREKW